MDWIACARCYICANFHLIVFSFTHTYNSSMKVAMLAGLCKIHNCSNIFDKNNIYILLMYKDNS